MGIFGLVRGLLTTWKLLRAVAGLLRAVWLYRRCDRGGSNFPRSTHFVAIIMTTLLTVAYTFLVVVHVVLAVHKIFFDKSLKLPILLIYSNQCVSCNFFTDHDTS